MRSTISIALAILGITSTPAAVRARDQPPFLQVDGVKAIAAGSINSPNPITGCDQAKSNAKAKAAAAGYKGRVEWVRLTGSSDCSLQTSGARGMGYFYIFTATGKFYR